MMIKQEYLHPEITAEIISAAFEVHKTIGTGFVESAYHRSAMAECNNRHLQYESKKELPVFYKNQKVGARRIGFLFKEKVVVEITAIVKPEDIHLAQAINCLEAFNSEAGLLINFGAKSLGYKRIIHPSLWRKK